ncbi:dehydrogenase [Bacillus thuringiensis]|uniref:Dehydrogenase n=1 Tax=Bacillus thuringiensis TaxID=1428 RepID=A0ABD6RUN5_BACTU|nr:SagB/ThcOx family dehydrogenase [Bacillus thuringiensis]PER42597.1 dehydrogenase [Bacillus thuringiensis]PEU82515.1 dehydrogenase [Bacillus thuringiensis]PFI11234.1 dehydrogenase [Bacillus thuringiensis]PFW34687.1 dehydrogenase [Bacillus thuringiensis]PGY65336.1 dehydrogenase [Bacillus thuringiensis]
MKKIKLKKEYFYSENFDFNILKKRRMKFETNRISWFQNSSPKDNYAFLNDIEEDFKNLETINYFINDEKDKSINQLFEERKSTLLNRFCGDWNKKELLRLIYTAIGGEKRTREFKGNQYGLRNYPSGGSLYPIKTYILVNNLQGMEPGPYYVSPDLGKLIKLESNYHYEFSDLFPMSKYKLDPLSDSTEKVNFGVFMVMDLENSFKKYGELSERLAFFEAGHIVQNLQLFSSYLDKKSLPICGLFPEEIEKILNIRDKEYQFCIYGILFG